MNICALKDGKTQIGFRPEKIQLSREEGQWLYCRKATILTREMLGSETLYKLEIHNADLNGGSAVVMSKSLDMNFAVDQEIYIGVDKEDLYYFDENDMRIRDEALLYGCYALTKEGEVHD